MDAAAGVCECCMKESRRFKALSNACSSRHRPDAYCEMLRDCFNIVVSSHDNSLICASCARRLRNAARFRRLVLRSQSTLTLRRRTEQLEIVKKEEFSSEDEPLSTMQLDTAAEMSPSSPLINDLELKKKECRDELEVFCKMEFSVKERKNKPNGLRTHSKYRKIKSDVCKALSENEAHALNTGILLATCNATPFKGKNAHGFRCFYCERCFKDPDVLRKHSSDEHRESRLNKVVPKFDAAECVLYLDISTLCCLICSENMTDLDVLRSHLKKIHNKTLHPMFGDRYIPFILRKDEVLDCQKCCQKFETFCALERHMNTHYRNFLCDICGSGYVTIKRLKTHAAFAHSDGSFPCTSCEKIFTSAVKVKKHFDSVHKLKNRYKCPQCSEKFYKYFQRQAHLVKEHNATPLEYKCNLCSRIFEMKDSLKKHTRKHHLLERNFSCGLCSYTCFTSTGLRNHMVSHTGERAYQCAICSKAYARKNTLTQHMKIHNNDRRYSCTVCGQTFVQNCSLKSHLRTHHSDAMPKGLIT